MTGEIAPGDPSPPSAPMSKAEARAFFRYLIASGRLRLDFAGHARNRLASRRLSAQHVRMLLAEGKVIGAGREVDGLGRSKYTLQGAIPDETGSKDEAARIVVLAAPRNPLVRVITAMWVEPRKG